MKKVINKGFTLTVTSWENDGDDYRKNSKTVETKEEAAKINKIFKELFKSKDGGGVGNSMGSRSYYVIEEYIEKNPELNLTIDGINDLSDELLGYSEYYDYRVCESCVVTYSPEDIYLEEVTF